MFTMDYSSDNDVEEDQLIRLDEKQRKDLRMLVKEGMAKMAEQEALEEEERHAREEAEGIADLNAIMIGNKFLI